MPQFILKHEYVPVSSYFIENHLKAANGVFVKVYLYALNLAFAGKNVETSYIAEQLDILESDVLQAFTHWEKVGVMQERNGNYEFGEGRTALPAEDNMPEEAAPENQENFNSTDMTAAISRDKQLAEMLAIAEQLLGRTLSVQDAETLYWFYDELGFSPEVVLVLLEYCVSKNKTHMNYIEKVAIGWHDAGISTLEQVTAHIEAEQERGGYLYAIRKIMGLTDRALSQREEQYLLKWRTECGMSEEMVALAYEYCILQTAKLSFPYMDRIIARWNKQGIKTVLQAEEDNRTYKEKNARNAPFGGTADHSELEEIARRRMEE